LFIVTAVKTSDLTKLNEVYSLVGTATGYGIDDRGTGVVLSAEAIKVFVLHSVQTGSGAHPKIYLQPHTPSCFGA
jgi:hypothetical protein